MLVKGFQKKKKTVLYLYVSSNALSISDKSLTAKSRGIEVVHLLDALQNSFEVLSKSNTLHPAAFSDASSVGESETRISVNEASDSELLHMGKLQSHCRKRFVHHLNCIWM